jgi:hypothetical protein
MSDLKDAIDQLANKQHDQFSTTVSDLLMDRLKGRIDNERFKVGQSIFADEEPEQVEAQLDTSDELGQDEPQVAEFEQPEETSDEEV